MLENNRIEENNKMEEIQALRQNKYFDEILRFEENNQMKKNNDKFNFQKKKRSIKNMVAMLATITTGTIITAAVAVSLYISIAVVSFNIGYTDLNVTFNIENTTEKQLYATIYENEKDMFTKKIEDTGEITLTFDNLKENTTYVLVIKDDNEKTHFIKEFTTASQIVFYKKEGVANRLYYRLEGNLKVTMEKEGVEGNIYLITPLGGKLNPNYSGSVIDDPYFDLSYMTKDEYTVCAVQYIVDYPNPVIVYETQVYIEGMMKPFTFSINYTDDGLGAYVELIGDLSMYYSFELNLYNEANNFNNPVENFNETFFIDFSQYAAGKYTLEIFGLNENNYNSLFVAELTVVGPTITG